METWCLLCAHPCLETDVVTNQSMDTPKDNNKSGEGVLCVSVACYASSSKRGKSPIGLDCSIECVKLEFCLFGVYRACMYFFSLFFILFLFVYLFACLFVCLLACLLVCLFVRGREGKNEHQDHFLSSTGIEVETKSKNRISLWIE